MPDTDDDWFTCPVCGEKVQADALACPYCGSDDETGWSAETEYDNTDLPLDEPWPEEAAVGKRQNVFKLAVAVLMLALILLLLFKF